MKLLTLNFLTCAVKTCKSSTASFPLQPKNCELIEDNIDANPKLILNILPRIDWVAMMLVASELGLQTSFPNLPSEAPSSEQVEANPLMAQELHKLLLETQISEGSLACRNCGHAYGVKEGIPNFLLPNHLV